MTRKIAIIAILISVIAPLWGGHNANAQTARPINSCITQVSNGTIEDAKARALALNSSINFDSEKMVVACNENTSIGESSKRIHVFIGKGLGNTVLGYAHNSGFNYGQLSYNNVYRFDYGLGGAYLATQNITTSTQWQLSEGSNTTNLRHWTQKNATFSGSWTTNGYTLTDNATPPPPLHNPNTYYKTTDNLLLETTAESGLVCSPVDITYNWLEKVRDSSRFDGAPYASLMAAVNGNGRWAVSQQVTSYGEKYVYVYWTEDSSLALEWVDGDESVRVRGNGLKAIMLNQMNHNGVLSCGDVNIVYYSENVTEYLVISGSNGRFENLFVYSDYLNLPSNYTGETIREDYEQFVTPDLTDQISFSYEVKNKEIRVWNTTPSPPIDNVKMVCQWTIANSSDGVLLNIISPCTEQHVTNVQTATYKDEDGVVQNVTSIKLDVLFDKNRDGIILPDETVGSADITVDIDGTSYGGTVGNGWQEDNKVTWWECINGNPPYIHLPKCQDNVAVYTSLLSFGVVNIGIPVVQEQCKTLGTIGDWMNLENKQVCPQVPSTIRNIITPFVVFAISLMVLKYLTSRKLGADTW